jgi:hypothetical protein
MKNILAVICVFGCGSNIESFFVRHQPADMGWAVILGLGSLLMAIWILVDAISELTEAVKGLKEK